MPYTNVLSLSPAVVVAVLVDEYTKGDADYSVTELLLPPRIGALRRRYAGQIIQDVADNLYSLGGQNVHAILERAGKAGIETWRKVYEAAGLAFNPELPFNGQGLPLPELVEERFILEIDGVRVSGCPDSLLLWPATDDDEGSSRLEDYKVTTVFAAMQGGKAEWVQQLNIYRYLLFRVRGTAPTHARIVVPYYRDWSKGRARREAQSPGSKYPRYQGGVFEIECWSMEEAESFLRERIRLHREADVTADNELPLCTDEERWVRSTKWAVTSPGRKRALRLYDTKDEAEQHALTSDKLTVEYRPGEPVRCLDWCPIGASGLCSQWEAERGKWDGKPSEDSEASSVE